MYELFSHVNEENLRTYVKAIEGLRHGWENTAALEKRADFIHDTFRSFGLMVENQEVPFHGRTFRNIIATFEGNIQEKEWLLLGAHYDAAQGSPGADDNASGIAVLLEAARIACKQKLNNTVQFVAFTLEEPQPETISFLIGSDHFARETKKAGRKYQAVFILESVGYTDHTEGSQIVPVLVRAKVPNTGNFLGIIANSRSEKALHSFIAHANMHVPDLVLVPYKVPLSGYIIPETRFSDHASFWKHGYPSLMLTDTAMFRNPHYHTRHDKFETLDFAFMVRVTKAVVSVIAALGDEEL
ncbi:MAG: M28 family peptidase [Thermodesulfovibrionales bacterium]|nr:M28 family peptidase [Thermodesulfovibrionales bacterium]